MLHLPQSQQINWILPRTAVTPLRTFRTRSSFWCLKPQNGTFLEDLKYKNLLDLIHFLRGGAQYCCGVIRQNMHNLQRKWVWRAYAVNCLDFCEQFQARVKAVFEMAQTEMNAMVLKWERTGFLATSYWSCQETGFTLGGSLHLNLSLSLSFCLSVPLPIPLSLFLSFFLSFFLSLSRSLSLSLSCCCRNVRGCTYRPIYQSVGLWGQETFWFIVGVQCGIFHLDRCVGRDLFKRV